MSARMIAGLVEFAGFVAIVVGVWMVKPFAGVIALGLFLAALGMALAKGI